MKAMTLHEHQAEAISAIEAQFAAGKKRTLAVLATGSGKTMIYLHLANKWANAGSRVLILAHRRELIHQPVDRAKDYFPKLAKKMGIVMASLDDADTQVTVATVQTVSRSKGRIGNDYDYIILDECHHGTAATYRKIFDRFPNARWLGLTATPFRTDGNSMSKIFDSVAYRFPITAAVDRGILVPFDAFGFTLPISIEGVTETMEGWDEQALGSLLAAENAIEVVYEKWLQYCSDRRTLCFTASVGQAYATAKYFQEHGIRSEAVDGTTNKKKRDGILRAFRHGRIQVVCNCQVWTEGVDVPEASAALMVCPTKSDLAYVQKLGRVLRTFPGKTNAIVLDFAPMEDRNIIMAGDILGIPRAEKVAKEKAEKAGVLVRAARVSDHGLAVSVDPSEIVVEALKYLRRGYLAWAVLGYTAVASLSDKAMLAIEMPDVGRIANAEKMKAQGSWGAKKDLLYNSLKHYRLWDCKKNGRWEARLVGSFVDMETAMNHCEALVNSSFAPKLAKKRRQWRNRPISSAQANYMSMLGILLPDNCNQGQAAQLISHELACRAIARIRKSVELQIMEGVK
jgi:superfamily II DNA or RNA helicase